MGLKKTPLKKVSQKKKESNNKDTVEKDMAFYASVWGEREHKCQACGAPLFEPRTLYFDHLLPKAKYPDLRYEKDNIFLCCWYCHNSKESGHPKLQHVMAIEAAKIKFLDGKRIKI